LTSKHTSTGAFVRAASGSGFQESPTGFYFIQGGVNVVSFDGSGMYLKGVIETSSGLIMGGAGLADIQFASGYTIGTAGGYLELSAGGSGVKINAPVLISGAGNSLTVPGSTQTAGLNNTGNATVCGSGGTMAFYGATQITKPITNNSTL
jgi:hypothetical protein